MRKVMLLAAMLAMVLAVAAPAFAQATSVQYSDDDAAFCNQVQNVADNTVAQYGDGNASTIEGDAAADVAAELGVSQEQVLNCFVGTNNGVNQQGNADTAGVVIEDDGSASAAAAGSASASASAGSASAAASTEVLPETGGASLLALGAGALLVAGGLLARRIVR